MAKDHCFAQNQAAALEAADSGVFVTINSFRASIVKFDQFLRGSGCFVSANFDETFAETSVFLQVSSLSVYVLFSSL